MKRLLFSVVILSSIPLFLWALLWWIHRPIMDPALCGTWIPILKTSYASYDDVKTHGDLYLGFDGKLKNSQFGSYKRKAENEDLPDDKDFDPEKAEVHFEFPFFLLRLSQDGFAHFWDGEKHHLSPWKRTMTYDFLYIRYAANEGFYLYGHPEWRGRESPPPQVKMGSRSFIPDENNEYLTTPFHGGLSISGAKRNHSQKLIRISDEPTLKGHPVLSKWMERSWIDENEQILFSGKKPDNGHYLIYNEDMQVQMEYLHGERIDPVD